MLDKPSIPSTSESPAIVSARQQLRAARKAVKVANAALEDLLKPVKKITG